MDFKGTKVLLLEGYARQCLPFMRAFKKLGCDVTILFNSKLDLAYVSRYADHKILGICDPERYEDSERYICDLIKNGSYDIVVPLVDFSASILSKNKTELSAYSKIASNDWDIYQIAADKQRTMEVCMKNRISCPYTLAEVNDIAEVLSSDIKYPIVVKPRIGCGAVGFKKIDSPEDLKTLFDTTSAPPYNYVFQEYIPQTSPVFAVNLFIDNYGALKSSFVYACNRWYPLSGGTGTFNQLVERPDMVEQCMKVVDALSLRGCIGFDVMLDPRDNVSKIIEINPRILACARIGFLSGVNLAHQILEKEFGYDVTEYRTVYNNVSVRMSQTDILWFIKSPDRFKVKPSWFSIKNTKDQTFYLDDPLPWFAFLFRGLKRFKKEMNKRK